MATSRQYSHVMYHNARLLLQNLTYLVTQVLYLSQPVMLGAVCNRKLWGQKATHVINDCS